MSVRFSSKVLSVAAAALLSIGSVGSALATDQTAHVSAVVAKAITLSESAPTRFGIIVPDTVAGEVTLSTAGTATSTGTGVVTIVTGAASTRNAGAIEIDGEFDATVQVSFGTSTALTSVAGPDMNIAWLAETASGPAAAAGSGPGTAVSSRNVTLDSAGKGAVYLGGKLTVGASQPAGTYTSTLTVTVVYN